MFFSIIKTNCLPWSFVFHPTFLFAFPPAILSFRGPSWIRSESPGTTRGMALLNGLELPESNGVNQRGRRRHSFKKTTFGWARVFFFFALLRKKPNTLIFGGFWMVWGFCWITLETRNQQVWNFWVSVWHDTFFFEAVLLIQIMTTICFKWFIFWGLEMKHKI